jgi:hypothetical protein
MMKKIFWICLLSLFSVSALAQDAAVKELNLKTRHLWDAKVEMGEVTELGATKHGTRRMIPITGGSFSGPGISGKVLPGGADFQLTRADGDTEFEARYMVKTDDGVAIQVRNRVLFHPPKDAAKGDQPYLRSVIELEAPTDSAYAYLNHAFFLGTLEVPQVKPGEKPYVIIGVYQLL